MVAAVVVSGIAFSFFVAAKVSSINALRSSIEKLYGSGGEIIAGRDKEPAEVDNLKKLFPKTSNVTEFVEDVSRISKRRALRNLVFEQRSTHGRSLKAVPPSPQSVIYVYPFKMSFNAGYRDMAEFLREIENQERLVTIESLVVKRDKDGLAVDMGVNVYSTEER
jgi:Tfp pilus assembly protein PilO